MKSDEADAANREAGGLDVQCLFVRERNALLVRADFEPLFVDYYLHQADTDQGGLSPALDDLFKRSLAALTLHCASRPWGESIAWTLHFQSPLVNVFVVGDNRERRLVGQVFTENVKEMDQNLLLAETARPNFVKRRSVVAFENADPIQAAEWYYHQSEQRPARYFELGSDDFVMISAQPDCDLAWLEQLTVDAVRTLDERESLSLLEQRCYRWECGCSQEKMLPLLAPAMRHDPAELFGDEPSLRMRCPRCGVRHVITREVMEAYVARKNGHD